MIPVEAVYSLAETLAAVRRLLSAERFRHVLGVRDTALELFSAWGQNHSEEDLLTRVALLHDVSKEMDTAELHQAIRKGWVSVGAELLEIPSLAHAPLSAAYARHRFGLGNPRALLAIAYHPTGHPDFDHLGLALFLADYLEPTRTFDNQREYLLAFALGEPHRAALEILKDKFHYVRLERRDIHPVALAFEQNLRQRNAESGMRNAGDPQT